MINMENTAATELVAGECIQSITDADRIESAISNAAYAAKDAEGVTLLILQDHLKRLCKQQRKLLKGKEGIDVVGIVVDDVVSGGRISDAHVRAFGLRRQGQ